MNREKMSKAINEYKNTLEGIYRRGYSDGVADTADNKYNCNCLDHIDMCFNCKYYNLTHNHSTCNKRYQMPIDALWYCRHYCRDEDWDRHVAELIINRKQKGFY